MTNTSAPDANWIAMFYLAGDNNLTSDLPSILVEMLEARPSPYLKVLALVDSLTGPPLLYRLTDEEILVETQPEDTGFASLEALLEAGKMIAGEGDHSSLVIFGHGPAIGSNGFLKDDNPPGYLSLTELAGLIETKFGQRIDLLGLDSCLMAEAEIVYELRGCADHLVASEGMARVDAWPFRELLDYLAKPSGVTPDQAARQLYQSYSERNLRFYYREWRSSDQVHLRAPDLSATLEQRIKPWANLLIDKLDSLDNPKDKSAEALRQALRLARLEAQSYWNEQFADLADFASLLADKCLLLDDLSGGSLGLGEVVDQSLAVSDALAGAILQQSYIGPTLQYSRGLSVYFPWTMPLSLAGPPSVDLVDKNGEKVTKRIRARRRTMFEFYLENSFAKDTGANWGEFLYSFFAATLRDMRGLPEAEKLSYAARKAKLKAISGKNISFEIGGEPNIGRFTLDDDLRKGHPNLDDGLPKGHPNLDDGLPKGHPNLDAEPPKGHPNLGASGFGVSIKNYPRANYPYNEPEDKKNTGWLEPVAPAAM